MRKLKKRDEENICLIDRDLATVYVIGEINFRMASSFRRFMRSLDAGTVPITVEINSHGGDIEAGLAMVDTIQLCKNPVTTRVSGVAMSMASVLLSCGSTREALPNSTIMIHQGAYSVRVPYDELDTEVSECKRLEKLISEILEANTGKPAGYFEGLCNGKNLYLTANDALKHNLVDTVLVRKKTP